MIAQQLGKYPGQITPENLSGLPKYAAYARLLIDGMPSNPFSLQTLPPRRESFDPERAEIIRRVVRRRFANGVELPTQKAAKEDSKPLIALVECRTASKRQLWGKKLEIRCCSGDERRDSPRHESGCLGCHHR